METNVCVCVCAGVFCTVGDLSDLSLYCNDLIIMEPISSAIPSIPIMHTCTYYPCSARSLYSQCGALWELCLQPRTVYIHDLCVFCLLCFKLLLLQSKKEKCPHFQPTRTLFIQQATVYEAGQEHWFRKEGCTNHCYVASTPRTSGLCWLPSCSHLQSCVLIFSALFLDHMERKGHRDTVYHRFVSVCERVRIHVRVCMYCLFTK